MSQRRHLVGGGAPDGLDVPRLCSESPLNLACMSSGSGVRLKAAYLLPALTLSDTGIERMAYFERSAIRPEMTDLGIVD